MSTEVRNIIVALRAKLDGAFSRTMKTAEMSVSSIASRAGSAAKWVGVGAAAAATGLEAMVLKTAAGMDSTGKLADRLGMTTESLAGLRHAANLADVSDLGGALNGWNKRLGEAVAGGGKAKSALETLGLSAKDLAAMPMDQQILRLSDALAAVPSPAQRAALSAALFGRNAGAEMATFLGRGSTAIRASMAEAAALGLTYNRSTASVAEAFKENLTRLKAAVAGAATQAAAALLPWWNQLSEGAIGWATSIMPKVQSAMVQIFGVIEAVAQGWAVIWSAVWEAASGVLNAFGINFSSTGDIVGGICEWIKGIMPTLETIIIKVFTSVMAIVGAFGAVWETVWGMVTDILGAFGITFSGTGDAVGKVCGWIVDLLTWLAAGVIKAITFIESVFVNWRDTLEIIWKSMVLGVVWVVEEFKYRWTVVMPKMLDWFAHNWKAVFVDLWNGTKAVISNLWTNLSNFFQAVWRWIKGEGWNFEWTGLLEGFKRTTEKLPVDLLATHVQTALEKKLASDIAGASGRIGSYYDTKVTERLGKLNSAVGAATNAAKNVPGNLAAGFGDAAIALAGQIGEKSWQKSLRQWKDRNAAGVAGKAAAAGPGIAAGAVISDNHAFGVLGQAMALHGLIANAAAPAADDPVRKTAANTSRMASTLDRMARRGQDRDSSGAATFTDDLD